ncbi:hypothetical protein PG996_000714 [Apiospora saccharicola]|uniref:Uncharacterized protein n=1 Tax=Apiospora saccharicola TaxID=335842 RepID=A0ABR1WIM4_9PEZI
MKKDNTSVVTNLALGLIGCERANCIRRAAFQYPFTHLHLLGDYFETAHHEHKHESNAIARLAEHCPGLKEVVFEESVLYLDHSLKPPESGEEEALEAFSRLDSHLWMAFPCLQRVVVHLCPPSPFMPRYRPAMEERMRKAGWTVEVEDGGRKKGVKS